MSLTDGGWPLRERADGEGPRPCECPLESVAARGPDRGLGSGASPVASLCLTNRPLIEGFDVDVSTVDHRKSAILSLKGKPKIRASEENRPGALDLA
jgi:hypothetical protein